MKIYQLKISIDDSKPLIWRRFQTPAENFLMDLTDELQIIMGWSNSHLHQFIHNKKFYGEDFDDDLNGPNYEVYDDVRLNDLLIKIGDTMRYEYDFGDSWMHTIVLEDIIEGSEDFDTICIEGENACPPEDIGGIHQYYEVLKIIKKPKHPDYNDYIDWMPTSFNPKLFNREKINERLKKLWDIPGQYDDVTESRMLHELFIQDQMINDDAEWERGIIHDIESSSDYDEVTLEDISALKLLKKIMDDFLAKTGDSKEMGKIFMDQIYIDPSKRKGEKLQSLNSKEFGDVLTGKPNLNLLYKLQVLEDDEYLSMPLVGMMHTYLSYIKKKKIIKLDRYGLPIQLIEELNKVLLSRPFYPGKAMFKTYQDIPEFALMVYIADELGWTRMKNAKIELLPTALVLLEQPRILFNAIWNAYLYNVNWSYAEDQPEPYPDLNNQGIFVILYYLMLEGTNPQLPKYYLDQLLHDAPIIKVTLLNSLNAKTPRSWYTIYENRVFKGFLSSFGLVSITQKCPSCSRYYTATDLFRKLIK